METRKEGSPSGDKQRTQQSPQGSAEAAHHLWLHGLTDSLKQLSTRHDQVNPKKHRSPSQMFKEWTEDEYHPTRSRVRDANQQIQTNGKEIIKLSSGLPREDLRDIQLLIYQAQTQTELASPNNNDKAEREKAAEELKKVGDEIQKWKDYLKLTDKRGPSPRETRRGKDITCYFRDTFASILEEKHLDVPVSELLKFDRDMPVKKVEEKYGKPVAKAFALARGRTAIEKCRRTPYNKDEVESLNKSYDHKAVHSFGGSLNVNTTSEEFGSYTCQINPVTGEITVSSVERTGGLHLDDILQKQHERVLEKLKEGKDDNGEEIDFDDSNLKKYHRVTHSDITNDETKDTIALFSEETDKDETEKDKFEEGTKKERYGKGTELYEVALGMPNGTNMLYFAKNHPDIAAGSEVQGLELIKRKRLNVDDQPEIILEDIGFDIT